MVTMDGLGSKMQTDGAVIILNMANHHGKETVLKNIISATRHSMVNVTHSTSHQSALIKTCHRGHPTTRKTNFPYAQNIFLMIIWRPPVCLGSWSASQ